MCGDEKKPVNDPAFWKTRLMWALSHGRGSHTAVYDIDFTVWTSIQNMTRSVLRFELRQGQTLLDVGCGIGTLSSYLPPGIKYHGIDISPEMVEVAHLSYPHQSFSVDDARYLPQFLNQHFDVAVCRSLRKMIIDNLGDPHWQAILQEVRRISKKVIIIEYEDLPNYETILT